MRTTSFVALAIGLTVGSGVSAVAQPAAPSAAQTPRLGPIEMPPVVVTAQKEPADRQDLPVSVSVVSSALIEGAGIVSLRDAGMFAPNTYYSDFSVRKVSNASFRGVGASPANPAVTTYIDGVPQLSANSSSLGLIDIGQIEFVRGPQSALFGRNTLGGIVNVTSRKPSLTAWTGRVMVPLANSGGREVAAVISGPLANTVGAGVAVNYGRRDGFTTNSLTGHTIGDRSAFEAKAQLSWTPTPAWDTRVIVTGERSRDGDYTLKDLDGLRSDPFTVQRDFEGHADRDVVGTTVLVRQQGSRLAFSSATGIVRWRTEDVTDLDYSPFPAATRQNIEKDVQFTQEVRLASAERARVSLGNAATMTWQAGALLFTQNYDQEAVNSYAAFVLSQFISFPVAQTTPRSALDDLGVGVFGHATLTFHDRIVVAAGGRLDHERRDALLETSYSPVIAAPTRVDVSKSFSAFSPQVSVSFRLPARHLLYGTVSQGFKAGGFNPASPAGEEVFDEEHLWQVEGGLKSTLAGGRVVTSAAVFSIDWQDLQVNQPDPFVPGQFFITNVGKATSRGVEVELVARPHRMLGLFASAGHTRARFSTGSMSMGRDVSGNPLKNTPRYTATIAAEVTHAAGSRASVGLRAESVSYGAFTFDETNTVGQDAYSLTNVRASVTVARLFAEAWARNVFDVKYVPIALPYPGTPSGYLGEPGKPRTFGVTLGVTF